MTTAFPPSLACLVLLASLAPLACAHREDAPTVAYIEMETAKKYVRWRLVETRYFVSDRRCGQGPFELRLSNPAGKYGDDYVLYLYTPRGLYGNVFAVYNPGDQHEKGTFGWGMLDNRACVLAPEEVAAASAGGGATAVTAAPLETPSGEEITKGTGTAAAPILLREIPRPAVAPKGQRVLVAASRFPNYGWNYSGDIQTVIYRLWSEVPNDLEGVVFVVGHRVVDLTVPNAQLVAEHRAELEARDRAKRQQASSSPPPASASPPRDPGVPFGMPPPAPAETPAPRPSANATWVPGYWHWATGKWLWLGGRWRVPPEDIARDLTVHAPAPPPAPRVEPPPPPPPAPTMVFAPGYWQWDGRTFIWIAGAWQLAPAGQAVWIPDRWEIRGSGAVFLPGGWRVRIQP